jgi:hypothetical protein
MPAAVVRGAGAELTRDEAYTIERRLFAYAAKEAQERMSLLRRWTAAERSSAILARNLRDRS